MGKDSKKEVPSSGRDKGKGKEKSATYDTYDSRDKGKGKERSATYDTYDSKGRLVVASSSGKGKRSNCKTSSITTLTPANVRHSIHDYAAESVSEHGSK